MRALRVLIGIIVGAALAALILRTLAAASNDLTDALRTAEVDDIRLGALATAGVGALVAFAIVIGRTAPAITVTCALGVLVPVGPAFYELAIPTWLPPWVMPAPMVVLSPIFALVAGALVLAAAWNVGSAARGRQPEPVIDEPDPVDAYR